MNIVVTIQIVGEGYRNLARREIVLSDLAGAKDIATVSYDVGRMVGPLLQTLAQQLEPGSVEAVTVID